jgi:hypothetical protein
MDTKTPKKVSGRRGFFLSFLRGLELVALDNNKSGLYQLPLKSSSLRTPWVVTASNGGAGEPILGRLIGV